MELKVHVSDHVDYQTARQIENYFNDLTDSQKQHVASSKDSFSYWLHNRAPQIYRKVSSYIDEIWSQIEDVLGEILEGVAIGAAAVVALPVIGAVEGIKAIGRWLDDL